MHFNLISPKDIIIRLNNHHTIQKKATEIHADFKSLGVFISANSIPVQKC